MNVLVGQCCIGDFQTAFPAGNRPHSLIRELYVKEFIPRVQQYCKNHDYQYRLLTDPRITFPHEKYTFHAQKMWYFSQYEDYDYFLWLDVDVFVNRDAPKFPFANGLTAVLDCVSSRGTILSEYPYVRVPFGEYFNSGVWGIDSLSAKRIWENSVKELLRGRYKEYENHPMVDQSLINQWVCENNITHNMLGNEWNTLICSPYWDKRHLSHFVHYAGPQKNKLDRILEDIRKLNS